MAKALYIGWCRSDWMSISHYTTFLLKLLQHKIIFSDEPKFDWTLLTGWVWTLKAWISWTMMGWDFREFWMRKGIQKSIQSDLGWGKCYYFINFMSLFRISALLAIQIAGKSVTLQYAHIALEMLCSFIILLETHSNFIHWKHSKK